MRKIYQRMILFFIVLAFNLSGCSMNQEQTQANLQEPNKTNLPQSNQTNLRQLTENNIREEAESIKYGVFLSLDDSDMSVYEGYDTVVIDAQYFTKENIQVMKENGQTVYSYLNVGSVEDFRDYYNDYVGITIGNYENWDGERWVDVSQQSWKNFIVDTLAAHLVEKGIDGFFIDNCDVYYYKSTDGIFDGLSDILRSLRSQYKLDIIINGGDTFVEKYYEDYDDVTDAMTGINQETVYSAINFDNETLGTATEENHDYFLDYVNKCDEIGLQVFLLEYTTDVELIKKIEAACKDNGWQYYISDSIELD